MQKDKVLIRENLKYVREYPNGCYLLNITNNDSHVFHYYYYYFTLHYLNILSLIEYSAVIK